MIGGTLSRVVGSVSFGLWSYSPNAAYVRHLSRFIPERDAVLVASCDSKIVEQYIVGDSGRVVIPFHRLTPGGVTYLQWRRPLHPGWIAEDIPDVGTQRRYRRMYENGAQDIYPYTLLDSPDQITRWLRQGHSVYLLYTGTFIQPDQEAINQLQRQFAVEVIPVGFPMYGKLPPAMRTVADSYFLARIKLREWVGTTLQLTADGRFQVQP